MPTREKAATIAELTTLLQHSQLAVVTNYRGLNVAALAQLRRSLRGKAELRVTKNTLLERAATEANVPQLTELLTGPTAVAFITDDIAGSIRALNEFVRTSRILTVTGALFGPSLVPADRVNELMSVPTRPQLLAQIVGNVQGPLNTLVGNLNQLVSQVVFALQAYADKKGSAADATPEALASSATADAAPEAATPHAGGDATPEASMPSAGAVATPEAATPHAGIDATPEAISPTADGDATPEAITPTAAAYVAPEDGALSVFDGDGVPEDGGPSGP